MGFWSNILSWVGAAPRADILTEGEPYWYPIGTGQFVDTDSGELVSTSNLKTAATCFACTKALSESIAGLPGMIYKLQGGKRIEAVDSEAYTLFTVAPNAEMDAFTFWDLCVDRLVNTGNFFAEIQRGPNDEPIALWPIHPSRVQPMRDNGDIIWEITHDHDGTP